MFSENIKPCQDASRKPKNNKGRRLEYARGDSAKGDSARSDSARGDSAKKIVGGVMII